MKRLAILAVALGLAVALPVAAQTKWDLPTAYPATNYHTENIVQFANDVDKASAGKLKIQVHPNASLFKAPEIKRAVQGGQAQAGESCSSSRTKIRSTGWTASRSSPPRTPIRSSSTRRRARRSRTSSRSRE